MVIKAVTGLDAQIFLSYTISLWNDPGQGFPLWLQFPQ